MQRHKTETQYNLRIHLLHNFVFIQHERNGIKCKIRQQANSQICLKKRL